MKSKKRNSFCLSLFLAFLSPLTCFAEINSIQSFSYGDQELLNGSRESSKGLLNTPNKCQLAQIIKSKPRTAELKASLQPCINLLSSTANTAASSKQWKVLAEISRQLIELKKYQQKTTAYSGGISGVGLLIGIDQHSNLVTITQVVPGAPAALAGLRVNDSIVSIDGKAIIITSNTDPKEIISQIRGAKGSSVAIRLRRGRKEWIQNLVRRPINTNTNSDDMFLREYVGLYQAHLKLNNLAGAKKTYPTLFSILRARYGDSSEEIASLMVDHASFLFHGGEQDKAFMLMKNAITIHEKYPEANKQALMLSYSKASFYLNTLRRIPLALTYQDKSLEIFRENPELQTSDNVRQLVGSIGFMAQSCTDSYLDKEKCFEYGAKSYELASKYLEDSDAANQLSLFYYANSVLTYRSFDEAIILFERLLNARQKDTTTDPKSILIGIYNIATKLAGVGRYFQAEQYYLKADKLALEKFGAISLSYLDAQIKLAQYYKYAGMDSSADAVINKMYRQALSLKDTNEESDQYRLMAFQQKLLSLTRNSSRLEAKGIVDKSMLLIRKYPNDPVAQLLGLQAKIHYLLVFEKEINTSKKYISEMIKLLDRYEKIHKANPGTEVMRINMLDTLSMIDAVNGDYPAAIKSASKLLDITRKKGRAMENMIPFRLVKLAEFQAGEGRLDLAEQTLNTAINEANKINSFTDLFSYTYLSLGSLAAFQGKSSEAAAYFGKFTTSYIDTRYSSLWRTPSSLRSQLSSPRPALDSIFQNHGNSPSYHRAALFSRLNFQGLIADIERSQNRLILGSNGVKQTTDKLQQAYRQASATGISTLEQKKLMLAIAELENELFEQVPLLKYSPIQVADIAKVLTTNSVLVEFQKYSKFPQQNRVYFSDQEKYFYVAFTLDSTGAVQRFDLGPAEVIDKAIARASHASSEGLSDVNDRWADVSNLIIAPLREAFLMSGEIFISPDSELNRVPFAALPSPFSSGFLVDTVPLRVLTSGRDLLTLSKQLDQQSKSSVVIANPSFDLAEATIERAQNSLSRTRSASIDSIHNGVRWAPLPATAKEGSAIASLIRAKLVHSAQATPMFVQISNAPKIIHIASHGYYGSGQQDGESIRGSNSFGNGYRLGESSNGGQDMSPNRINPLLKSGIVLAGANHPTTNLDDDGYLTALEVSRLQLNGTELFVVSACASGQGDVQTGEGVYGLSRAIAVAGARSSLLSLWKVDDAATAEFMIRFYKRLKAGEGRSDALAAVQKEFRAGTAGDGKWKEPYYWAAWQLVGDWRPIPGL